MQTNRNQYLTSKVQPLSVIFLFCAVCISVCCNACFNAAAQAQSTDDAANSKQAALEKLQDDIDKLTSVISEKALGKPLTAEEQKAAETILNESAAVLERTDISEKFRHWTTGRRMFALIHLAYTNKPKYFGLLNSEFDALSEQKGMEKYAKMAEEHILRIAEGLVIQPAVAENGKKFGIDAGQLTDWLVDYAKRYPSRESSALLENLLARINEMPNRFQRDRLLTLTLQGIVDYFRNSDNPLDVKTAQKWAAVGRRISLPGNPMKLTGWDINAVPFSINGYKGKAILVVFWGTWCIHCREETPRLIELYNKYRSKGFEIIGVNTGEKGDSNAAKVRDYVEKTTFGDKKEKIGWNVILDSLAEKNGGVKLSDYYGIEVSPEYVLIGRDGNVIKLNPLMSALDSEIEDALFPKEELKQDKELQEVLRKRDAEVLKEIEQYEKEKNKE